MKSSRRKKFQHERKRVKPVLQDGAGRWLLLLCEHGHYLRSIPYGEWTDARRKYERKSAHVKCGRCAQEVGKNGRT
jgi:hypothetical protein